MSIENSEIGAKDDTNICIDRIKQCHDNSYLVISFQILSPEQFLLGCAKQRNFPPSFLVSYVKSHKELSVSNQNHSHHSLRGHYISAFLPVLSLFLHLIGFGKKTYRKYKDQIGNNLSAFEPLKSAFIFPGIFSWKYMSANY